MQLLKYVLRIQIVLLTIGVENLLYNRLLRNYLRRYKDDWTFRMKWNNGVQRTKRNATLYRSWASLFDYLLDHRTYSVLKPLIDGDWKRALSLRCHLLSSL